MEEYEEYGEYEGGGVNKVMLVIIIVLALVIAAGCVYFFFFRKTPEADTGPGYAINAGVVLTQEQLDAALAEAARNAENGSVGLKYKNGAYSDNGRDFDCYIVNSEANLFDMFITIFADPDMTDQIYLSGLIPRGGGITELTLDRALEQGDHTVYVAVTQVKKEEDGTEVIANQVVHTMDFHVS